MLDDDAGGRETIEPRRTTPAARDGLLTLTEAAALLNVSKITLRRWTKSGILGCVRIGRRKDRRFRRADIEEFIATHVGETAAVEAAAGEAEGSVARESPLSLP
jgi:excisionase family DNA binding protein